LYCWGKAFQSVTFLSFSTRSRRSSTTLFIDQLQQSTCSIAGIRNRDQTMHGELNSHFLMLPLALIMLRKNGIYKDISIILNFSLIKTA